MIKNYKQGQDRGEINTKGVSSRVAFCVRYSKTGFLDGRYAYH
jgi:hypothetical protein